jgi:hypothetical protein
MKCYTVTEQGVTAGIAIASDPYPHVGVGDPNVAYDYRRVEIDEALATTAASGGSIRACSVELDMSESDSRRASYKLITPAGTDEDQALVKLEVHPGAGGRTFYDLPRHTVTLAKGAFTRTAGGPHLETPVELVVIRKGGEVDVYKSADVFTAPKLAFSVGFDGSELRKK